MFSNIIGKNFIILGEIKPGSPTQGVMYDDHELDDKITSIGPAVDGISVLTEPNYFHGSLTTLTKMSKYNKPVLMKDFIIDEQQIDAATCSSILLINRILSDQRQRELIKYAKSKNIETILEVDNEADFVNNLDSEADILAVNNRNLNTMRLDTSKAGRFIQEFQVDRPILGLSGYTKAEQVITAYQKGLSGVLIGTALSKADNPENFVQKIRSNLEEQI